MFRDDGNTSYLALDKVWAISSHFGSRGRVLYLAEDLCISIRVQISFFFQVAKNFPLFLCMTSTPFAQSSKSFFFSPESVFFLKNGTTISAISPIFCTENLAWSLDIVIKHH